MSTQSIDPSDSLYPPSGPMRKVLKVIAILLMLGAVGGMCYASYGAVMALAHHFGFAA